MPFFHYSQNNSGGSFEFNEPFGITHHVVIEAPDYRSANARAEEIGIYFNGCEDGRDCPCCGDRWYPESGEGDPTPMVYHEPADEAKFSAWMPAGKEICIHFLDGRTQWHGVIQESRK